MRLVLKFTNKYKLTHSTVGDSIVQPKYSKQPTTNYKPVFKLLKPRSRV